MSLALQHSGKSPVWLSVPVIPALGGWGGEAYAEISGSPDLTGQSGQQQSYIQ